MVIKTTEDGWDCVPGLKEAVRSIDLLRDHVYEIKNCVRAHELEFMVDEMKGHLIDAIDILDQIDVNEEFETVDDY